MTEGLNKVMLLGNIGADPELRHTQGGQAILHLRLATSETYLDKDKVRKERTEWHNVTVWGARGEALSKFLKKGSTIFVEGSLRTSSYDNREGQKVWKTEVNALNVILAGGKRGEGGGSNDNDEDPEPGRGGGGNSSGGGGNSGGGGQRRQSNSDGGRAESGSRQGRGGGSQQSGGQSRGDTRQRDPDPADDSGGEGEEGGNGPDSIPF